MDDKNENFKKITLVFIILTAVANASAAVTFGGADCGEWIRSPSEPKRQWLIGYMSGLNMMHFFNENKGDPLDKINSAQQIYLWMDNYCRDNPLKRVSIGAETLFIELMKKQ